MSDLHEKIKYAAGVAADQTGVPAPHNQPNNGLGSVVSGVGNYAARTLDPRNIVDPTKRTLAADVGLYSNPFSGVPTGIVDTGQHLYNGRYLSALGSLGMTAASFLPVFGSAAAKGLTSAGAAGAGKAMAAAAGNKAMHKGLFWGGLGTAVAGGIKGASANVLLASAIKRAAMNDVKKKLVPAGFAPDYTPDDLENMGVYDAIYRGKGPRLASLGEWKPEWVNPVDPQGWAQWYKRYSAGRRLPEEDERQIKRWTNFKSRHGGPFSKNPTPRRGWALRNWAIDPSKLVDEEHAAGITEMLDKYRSEALEKYKAQREKTAAVYNFEGDVQGVSLRKTLHKVLDDLQHPGLAYNNARAGEAIAVLPGSKKKQQEILTLLRKRLADRAAENKQRTGRPGEAKYKRPLQEGVDYKITPVPAARERMHEVTITPEGIQDFIRSQGFNRLGAESVDYQKQWLNERYRLQPDAAGNLAGKVPTLAKKQLLSGEPIYGYQLEPGWQDVKAAATYYHGSPDANIEKLRSNSYVTPDKNIAETMGRFYEDTGQTWSDDDLDQPYDFGPEIHFKAGREPTGKPTIYTVNAEPDNLDMLDNPYEHKTKLELAVQKAAALNSDVMLQEQQQRVADRIAGPNPRLLVYHGLGSGKSLSSIAAAEAAKKKYEDDYGIVAPASLRDNFQQEVDKFTVGSNPQVMSYTGLGQGKQFENQPGTVIMDEAGRLVNQDSARSRAALAQAQKARRLMLLTGTPIVNEPADMAGLLGLLEGKKIDKKQFTDRYVGQRRVYPGILGFLSGASPGERSYIKHERELRKRLAGLVDYHPSKKPEGVEINESVVRAPLSAEQKKIQKAIRTKVPPGFLWKIDKEFPLTKEELRKLNSFLTGMRQVSLSTQPFRADADHLKSFEQSGKLQTAYQELARVLQEDKRKKALIYSNFVDAGLKPYAAGLAKNNIPHAVFHGGIPEAARRKAVQDYNNNKLRALLIGPAGAEGISTKGTSLIQLLDPHWNEARTQQARGRGLRFDSHKGLPENLKNVLVHRYISESEDPSFLQRLFGKKRERTGDEVLERLTAEKEQINDKFRELLQEVGQAK